MKDDLISRQAAIDAVSEACEEWRGIFARCKEKLLSLSSAQPKRCEDCENFSKTRLLIPQPERKKGRWVNMIEKGLCYCDQCGFTQETERAFASLYCCKCGAAMIEEGAQK